MEPVEKKAEQRLCRRVTRELSRLANQMRRHETTVPVARDLTHTQSRILLFILRAQAKGAVYQKQIEREFSMRASTASVLIAQLERKGYLRRETGGTDARYKQLVPTEAAHSCRSALAGAMREWNHLLTEGITPEEMEQFLNTIAKMRTNLSRTEK